MEEDGILPLAVSVTGPEVKLIPRPRAGLKIDERGFCDGLLRFREVERDLPHQPIMIGDNKNRFPLSKQLMSRLTSHASRFRPSAHAMERVLIDREQMAA